MAKITLDPVTRIEGHLKVEVEIDGNNTVTAAHSSGNLFRGFEAILKGRDPRDAVHITQRICGLCPVSHSIAAVKAAEEAFGFTPSKNAVLMRSLILGGNYISDHILHFYHLAIQDYVQLPQQSPWTPGYNSDFRFTQAESDALVANYLKALEMRRKAHEMTALFSGKIPHVMSITAGGVTQQPNTENISKFRTYLNEIQAFVNNEYMDDLNVLASKYSDYYSIGGTVQNLLTYGVFDTNTSGGKLFNAGVSRNGSSETLNLDKIKEYVGYSHYSNTSGLNPADGETIPDYTKSGSYSWLKAPRYNNDVFEVGPLARMIVNGYYDGGISVMDRHVARGLETQMLTENMQSWLSQLVPGSSSYTQLQLPTSGTGIGLTEAPRGALGHWLDFSGSTIDNYQVVTPTCWNVSPRDDMDQPGALEQALVGVKVANPDQPIELLRVIHSFDPCTGCSVHIIDAEKRVKSQFVVSTPNPAGIC